MKKLDFLAFLSKIHFDFPGFSIFKNFKGTKKNRPLASVFHECTPGRRQLAGKVVDILGNDTMTIVEVGIGGKK